MQLDDLGGLTFRELMKREIHDVFHGPWTVEIGTVNIRFPNRVVNVIASIGGMFLADPGDYSLEFLIANPKTGETIATGSIQAIPTIKSLVFGNPFARESSLKKAFRNQTRAMRNYWLAKQTSCGFDQ